MKIFTRTVSYIVIVFFFILGASRGYTQELKIGGTGAGLAILRLLADAFENQQPDATIIVLPSLGSSGGIKAIAAGAVQLAVSSRDLRKKEREQGLKAVEFGRTPFVFVVSASSEVENITLAQLVDIYSGKTTRWPDGSKIRIVLRPVSDGDSKMIRSMSPAMEKAKKQAEGRRGMLFAVTDQDTQKNLERIPGAFGGTSLGQIIAERRGLKALSFNGVRPSPRSLADGSYPYGKHLFLITGSKTPFMAQHFVEFVRSPAGRDLLAQNGYWVP